MAAPNASTTATSVVVRPHVALLVAATVAVAVLTFSGVRSQRLDVARRKDLQRAESVLSSFADLHRRYEPAVAAESIAWRRAWLELQELGVGTADRLSLTQRVARAAEDAGLRDVRVLIGASDTTGPQPRLSAEGAQSSLAPYSLRVECRGGLASVVAFLGHLPPSVAATRLSLVRQDGRGPHQISLAVYEFTFTNGAPPGWSSLEHSGSGTGDVRRPGG